LLARLLLKFGEEQGLEHLVAAVQQRAELEETAASIGYEYLMNARMVRCDEVPWKMWNISMAGWNAILSGTLALVLSITVFNHVRAKT